MKACVYCGRENEDDAVNCIECGTDEFKSDKRVEAETTRNNEFSFGKLSGEDFQKPWVTLVTCRTLPEADLIVCQLEAAGIPTFLPDKFLMQAISWNLNTYGYVRVQVSPKDYEAASELLSAPEQNNL